jgi:two-component system NtrC family sensor kinase
VSAHQARVRIDLPSEVRPPQSRLGSARRNRGFALLWLAVFLLPAFGMTVAGVSSWRAIENEARTHLEHTAELLRQNALRSLAMHEAMMIAVARAVNGRPLEDLHDDRSLHALLAELVEIGGPAISDLLLADQAGRVVSASGEFPAEPAALGGREEIALLRQDPDQRAVGVPITPPHADTPIIPVARSVAALIHDASASGFVVCSASAEALTAFYAEVVETPNDVVALFRDDGAMLARHPAPVAGPAEPPHEQIRALLADLLASDAQPRWLESPLDGASRLVVARHVGQWPISVVYGLDRDALLAAWRERMAMPAAGGIAAMLLLIALTAMAQRGARLQQEQAESRAEAEAQLAQAGRAAAMRLLAGGVAHDVKNLVQAVRSGARVMQRRADDPEEVRRCAELLCEAAERGGRLVDAMLAFGRGGIAEEGSAPPLVVDVALRKVAELLGRTLGGRWPVRTQLQPDLPTARGDRAAFEAAVVNLAANARDAMPGGGVVTIAAWVETLETPDEVAGLPAGRYVVIAVVDTGSGMDAATLARLGEPFFTTKPHGQGTGLGLPTVRGFCASSGGALRLESNPGSGSTAAMWLPAA